MAVKDNVGIFFFAVLVPLHMYFDDNGQMDKRDFLQLWKEIPEKNEIQYTLQNPMNLSAGLSFIQNFEFSNKNFR